LLAETGQSLSETVAQLPVYAIVKDKVTVPRERLTEAFAKIEKRWPEAKVNRVDGVRLDWPNRWLHLRASNTEPIVRIIAEAPRREEAAQMCREVATLL